MPRVGVVFFRDTDDRIPVLAFLSDCARRDQRVVAKFQARVERLEEMGWELTRPEADTLRDGIHELRVRFSQVNYRLLYGFYREGNAVAILAHGMTKEGEVPAKDIDAAKERLRRFALDPERHTFRLAGAVHDLEAAIEDIQEAWR